MHLFPHYVRILVNCNNDTYKMDLTFFGKKFMKQCNILVLHLSHVVKCLIMTNLQNTCLQMLMWNFIVETSEKHFQFVCVCGICIVLATLTLRNTAHPNKR